MTDEKDARLQKRRSDLIKNLGGRDAVARALAVHNTAVSHAIKRGFPTQWLIWMQTEAKERELDDGTVSPELFTQRRRTSERRKIQPAGIRDYRPTGRRIY